MLLQREVYALVKKYKGCAEGLTAIAESQDISDLIALMKSAIGIEFLMQTHFFPIALFEQYRSALEKEHIFFDGKHEVENPRLLLVLAGEVRVDVHGFAVCDIYTKGSVDLYACGDAFVSVESFAAGKLIHTAVEQAKVREFKR